MKSAVKRQITEKQTAHKKPSRFEKIMDLFVAPFITTIFEFLLLGFATFFPAYYFKIKYPLVIYFQLIVVSSTVAFFQGCRSLGHLSYMDNKTIAHIKKHLTKKHLWLPGIISAVPINLIILIYFHVFSKNPVVNLGNMDYLRIYILVLVIINSVSGISGIQQQYQAIKQKDYKGPMGYFYPAAIFMLLGWIMIFLVMVFVMRLDISGKFPL